MNCSMRRALCPWLIHPTWGGPFGMRNDECGMRNVKWKTATQKSILAALGWYQSKKIEIDSMHRHRFVLRKKNLSLLTES